MIGLTGADEDFTDGVFIWPQIVGHGGTDDNDALAVRAIVPGKVAAVKAHTQGMHIAGRNDIDEWAAEALKVVGVATLRDGHAPGAVLAERKIVRCAGSLDAGNGRDTGENLLKDDAALRGPE